MRDSAYGGQSGFAHWLRTGRWPDGASGAAIERKFNPWHDPDDGRFTFAGTGRHYGSGRQGRASQPTRPKRHAIVGGGGTFGGGGASGSFGSQAETTPKPTPRPIPTYPAAAPDQLPFRPRPPVKPAPTRPVRTPPWRKVVRGGYEYQLDEFENTRQIDGILTDETKTPRSRAAQRNAGKPDRLPTDDGGHFIAHRFNGPKDAFNHFAQDAAANRGVYRVLEQEWADALARRKTVSVTIIPIYPRGSRRPSRLEISYKIGGVKKERTIDNRHKPKPAGHIRGKSR